MILTVLTTRTNTWSWTLTLMGMIQAATIGMMRITMILPVDTKDEDNDQQHGQAVPVNSDCSLAGESEQGYTSTSVQISVDQNASFDYELVSSVPGDCGCFSNGCSYKKRYQYYILF